MHTSWLAESENFTVPNCTSDKNAPRGLLLKNLKHETNYRYVSVFGGAQH